MSQCLSSINSMLSGVHSLDYTHTHIPSHTKTHSYSQTYTHTDPPTLHQDDLGPLSVPYKDSVSWDDVTATFLMGVNLCLVEQQQKNLCVALSPNAKGRMSGASAPFYFSACDFSTLTFPSLPGFFFSLCIRMVSCFLFLSLFFLHLLSLSLTFFFAFIVLFSQGKSRTLCSFSLHT